MFSLFQILVVMAFIAGIILFFLKFRRKEKSIVAGLIISVMIAAVISNGILNLIPLPTDEVIVSAVGEKNKDAGNDEVSIINYIVGGEEYAVKNPIEGKWFWKGDVYMWRNENDSRQPKGTTRSITLQIPYGKDRSIQFGLSPWNGFAEVTYAGESQQYDLFKNSDETSLCAPIPDTAAFALYGVKLLRMIIFVLMIATLMVYPIFCTLHYKYDVIRQFGVKHWDKIYYIALAVLYIFVMQKNSIEGSFWGDEIWELGWKYPECPYSYTHSIVYYELTKAWFYLMPYGQEHLLLLPQIFVAGTIYLAGIIGNRINGKRLGILFSSLVAFSLSIVYQCAMEYRVYAFLLFSTALLLFSFINKFQHLGKERYSDIIVHSLVITLTMDMHTFGIAVAGLIMIADFMLIVFRKSSAKCLLEFIIPGVYGIWWIRGYVLQVAVQQMDIYASWMSPPNAARIVSTVTWLMGSSSVMFGLLIFGISIILVRMLGKIIKREFSIPSDYIQLVIALIPMTTIFIVYIYSTVLNPEHPLFFDRYFISILIFLLCIASIALDEFIYIVGKIGNEKYVQQYTTLFLLLILCISFWSKVGPWEIFQASDHTRIMRYRQQADYLLEQNDIYSDRTFFVLDHNDEATVGYQYYLRHKNTRDIIQYDNKLPNELENYDVIYYSYAIDRNKNKILSSKIWSASGFYLEEDLQNVNILKFSREKK